VGLAHYHNPPVINYRLGRQSVGRQIAALL
jgi:hypothetical protein